MNKMYIFKIIKSTNFGQVYPGSEAVENLKVRRCATLV